VSCGTLKLRTTRAGTQALRAAAVAMVRRLAASHPTPFRAVVEAMPAATKLALQTALASASAPVATAGVQAGAAVALPAPGSMPLKAPSIALKSFGAPPA